MEYRHYAKYPKIKICLLYLKPTVFLRSEGGKSGHEQELF